MNSAQEEYPVVTSMAHYKKYDASTDTGGSTPLQHGGGGGTSGGMEARVARLESDMEHVKKGVDRLEAGQSDIKRLLGGIEKVLAGIEERTKDAPATAKLVTTLDERTKHMPTRWEVFMIFVAVVAVVGGVVALTARFLPTS